MSATRKDGRAGTAGARPPVLLKVRPVDSAPRWVRRWRRMVRPALRRLRETDVGALEGLTPEEADDLRGAGMRSIEALMDRVATRGLRATADGRLVSFYQLRAALTAYSLRGARRAPLHHKLLRLPHRLWAAWLEVLLAGLVAVLVGLGVRAGGGPERDVVPRHDLPPYQVIAEADLEERTRPAAFGTFDSAGDVAGRFPLRAAKARRPLRRDGLSDIRLLSPDVLRDRRIVSLSIPPHSLPLAVPGRRVGLLLSPREPPDPPGASPPILEDVLVLEARVGTDRASLVVAVREADLAVLGRSLASADVFILQQVAPPPVRDSPAP